MNPQTPEYGDACDTLRQQLAGAQAEVDTYRLREFASYQALGYAPPVNDTLPVLIQGMMGLKARLQDSLDSIERATGFQPGTEPLATWVERLVRERDAAQEACAEMRAALEMWRPVREQILTKTNTTKAFNHALSTDCGCGYVPRERVKPLIVALIQIYASGRQYSGAGEAWAAICTAQSIAKQAIAHARGLGL